MVVNNKFDIGQTVYLITDVEQLARIVTSINVNKHDEIYVVACGTTESRHYDYEMSGQKVLSMI